MLYVSTATTALGFVLLQHQNQGQRAGPPCCPSPPAADYRPTPLEHYVFPAGGDGLFLAVDSKGTFR